MKNVLTNSFIPPSFLLHTSFIPLSFLLHTSFILTSYLFHTSFILTSYLLHSYFTPLSYLFHSYFIPLSYLFHSYFIVDKVLYLYYIYSNLSVVLWWWGHEMFWSVSIRIVITQEYRGNRIALLKSESIGNVACVGNDYMAWTCWCFADFSSFNNIL